MATHIYQDVLETAKDLHAKRDTLGAWKVLADAEDAYANATYHIGTSVPSFWTHFRQAHWRLTTHTGMDSALWHDAAHASLGHYLEVTEGHRDEFCGDVCYALPNTKEIEECHIQSTSEHGVPRKAIIHLVSNSVTTRFNKFCGLVDGPDWHEPLSREFGSMKGRMVDSSENFSKIGFGWSAALLAVSASYGAVRYGASKAREVAPYINLG